MILFGIPLKAKAVSRNWELVTTLFNRTVWSLYNQTCPEFRIVVACHDVPRLNRNYDDRLEFISVTFPFPRTVDEQMTDKGYKVHMIGKRFMELGGGFGLIADADDLYSNRLAQFVKENPGQNGWVTRTGYEYIWNKEILKLSLKHPPQPIVNYRLTDLPADDDDAATPCNINAKYLIKKSHGDIPEICRIEGRPLKSLPFIGHVYVKYHGESLSVAKGDESALRRTLRFFMPKIDPRKNQKVRKEFSIDWL
jgi:hypothetical protein